MYILAITGFKNKDDVLYYLDRMASLMIEDETVDACREAENTGYHYIKIDDSGEINYKWAENVCISELDFQVFEDEDDEE
jgi:hypothetical protein